MDLKEIGQQLTRQMNRGEIPSLDVPSRQSSNIEFDPDANVYVLGNKTGERSGKSIQGAKKLMKMIATINYLIEENEQQTLREIYYLSESWDIAQFSDQEESDKIIQDLEVLTGKNREDLGIRSDESRGMMYGDMTVREQTQNGQREIHLRDEVAKNGHPVPLNPEEMKIVDHDVDFVLAIETGGMYSRLIENEVDKEFNCLLMHTKGQPTRPTKRILSRLSRNQDIDVLLFSDADPWSYRIFGAIKFGATESAHLSRQLATPDAKYLGLRPTDIRDLSLPSDDLSDQDERALHQLIDDKRFDDSWDDEFRLQIQLGQKSEQQSLASKSLDYVAEEYLPQRLTEMNQI